MSNDFDQGEILVRYYSDLWGGYSFNFASALPSGASLASCTVRAFIGNVKPSSDLEDFTEVTALLIDPAYTPATFDLTKVLVKFQYPGVTYANQKASLVFECKTDNAAKHPFIFKYVKIQGEPPA